MRLMKWFAATLFALSVAAGAAQSQSTGVVAIRAGHLFDSKSGKMLDSQVILIKEDKITDVGSSAAVQIPVDAQVIDLSFFDRVARLD